MPLVLGGVEYNDWCLSMTNIMAEIQPPRDRVQRTSTNLIQIYSSPRDESKPIWSYYRHERSFDTVVIAELLANGIKLLFDYGILCFCLIPADLTRYVCTPFGGLSELFTSSSIHEMRLASRPIGDTPLGSRFDVWIWLVHIE